MPAAAAAALLDWQPVLVLEKENYALREENRHLHFQVRELLSWKERALKQMLALGPSRQRASRDVQHATQLQRKLQAVDKSLQERGALEAANQQLEEAQRALQEQVATLEREREAARRALEDAQTREQALRVNMQQLADRFREHLEQLVAVRERVDAASTTTAAATGVDAADHDDGKPAEQETDNNHATTGRLPGEDVVEDAAVLVAGLAAVSASCSRWLEQHVALALPQLQETAARFEAQQAELRTLRARAAAVRQDVDESAARETQRARQLASAQEQKAQLEIELRALRAAQTAQAARAGHAAMGDHVRLLVTEVRQYLRLVRGEIRRKFGYVPEAIAHAEGWARILDALDALERQLRIAHA